MPDDKELRIGLLLHDYNNARDDERYYLQQQGNLLSIGVAALGALFLIAQQLVSDPGSIPDGLVAAAPLVVLAFLYYAQYISSQSILRGLYLRALERELRSAVKTNERVLNSYPALPILSLSELMTGYTSQSQSSRGFGGRVLNIVYVALISVFGAIILFFALKISLSWRILMLIGYGLAITFLLLENWQTVRRGRSFFDGATRVLNQRLLSPLTPDLTPQPRQRSLTQYLVIPRPDDLATKSWFTLGGVVAALLVANAGITNVPGVLIFLFGFELLCYQARYQWNDIRGATEDAASPSAVARDRLPGGHANIGVSLLVFGVRLALIGWSVAILSETTSYPQTARTLLIASGTVFLIAIPYEVIRKRIAARGCSTWSLLCISLLVCMGYPVRFVAGWFAAGGGPTSFLALSAIALAFLAPSFIAPPWVLEAMSYVGARSGTSSRFTASASLDHKPHLIRIAGLSGVHISTGPPSAAMTPVDGRTIELKDLSLRYPPLWNICAVPFIALALCAAPTFLGFNKIEWSSWFLLPSLVPLLPFRQWSGGLSLLLSAVAGGTLSTMTLNADGNGFLVSIGVGSILLIPFFLVVTFHYLSYERSRGVIARALSLISRACYRSYLWFVGA